MGKKISEVTLVDGQKVRLGINSVSIHEQTFIRMNPNMIISVGKVHDEQIFFWKRDLRNVYLYVGDIGLYIGIFENEDIVQWEICPSLGNRNPEFQKRAADYVTESCKSYTSPNDFVKMLSLPLEISKYL